MTWQDKLMRLMTQMLLYRADVAGLIILPASVSFFHTSYDLLPLLTVMAQEMGLRDSAWARQCEGRGCGVATGRGPVDALIHCRC
jgi:hypothetical protein